VTPARDERGAGVFSTVAGLVVFLALLLFAVETLIGLYTRSVVADAAWHGARVVAGARTAHADGAALDEARATAEDDSANE
jgi:Flp pilus assembly protein TadG